MPYRRPAKFTAEQLEQVLNNVSEEYVDHGDTSFANKECLCEAILYEREQFQKGLNDARARSDEWMLRYVELAIRMGLINGKVEKDEKENG